MLNLVDTIHDMEILQVRGKVTKIVGLVIAGYCPEVSVGSLCEVTPLNGAPPVFAEVVGFRESQALLMPLGELRGLGPGSLIRVCRGKTSIKVGPELLGRVIDAMENPLDGLPPPKLDADIPIYSLPPHPMQRRIINEPLDLGIRAINGMLTCGIGQRMAIMAGSGVGKSVLLGMIAKNTKADINVIALIGERGREVKEFIESNLGKEGLARSIVVVATSDQSPLLRMRGAFCATAIAEYFCEQGNNVLLMMDSVTRFAMGMREVGLAVGEPPTTKGYTPTVFATLPKLLERAGSFSGKGSITGLYTVLVEGDDMNEPIADAVRSILDGHIVLSRKLAEKNHYPAIDILQSSSRVMRSLVGDEDYEYCSKIKEILATYSQSEDLINIGAYPAGSNPQIDYALQRVDSVNEFLRQKVDEKCDLAEARERIKSIVFGRREIPGG
jgi:flagellum-specific ATP synthase